MCNRSALPTCPKGESSDARPHPRTADAVCRLLPGPHRPCRTAGRHPPAWTLNFTDNPKLPPAFREFTIPRPDATKMRAYLADFSSKTAARKPLMIYLDGSGAGSLFVETDGRVGVTLFGLLAQAAHTVRCQLRQRTWR